VFLQVEKQRTELQHELDDLSQRLDEAGGATQAQVSFAYLISSYKENKLVIERTISIQNNESILVCRFHCCNNKRLNIV